MSIWQETTLADRHMVMASTELFYVSFFRAKDDGGWAVVNIVDVDNLQLDEHRPPVMIVDGKTPCDLAVSKSLERLQQDIDPGAPPVYIGEPIHTMARVWHGKLDEGLGFFEPLLEGRELALILYQDNYDIQKTTFPLNDLALMRRVLRI